MALILCSGSKASYAMHSPRCLQFFQGAIGGSRRFCRIFEIRISSTGALYFAGGQGYPFGVRVHCASKYETPFTCIEFGVIGQRRFEMVLWRYFESNGL